MISKIDFENIVSVYLFTLRQHTLLGLLHSGVKKEVYESNIVVWNILLLSLEFGSIQGLANLLENKKYFGKKFRTPEFDNMKPKILKWRNEYTSHLNLSVLRNFEDFRKRNQINGLQVLRLIVAMGRRLDAFNRSYAFGMNVEELFNQAKREAYEDLKVWIRCFGIELGQS